MSFNANGDPRIVAYLLVLDKGSRVRIQNAQASIGRLIKTRIGANGRAESIDSLNGQKSILGVGCDQIQTVG